MCCVHRHIHCISRPAGRLGRSIRFRSLSHLRFLFPFFIRRVRFFCCFFRGPVADMYIICCMQQRTGKASWSRRRTSATWTLPPPGWGDGRTPSMHTAPSLLGRMQHVYIVLGLSVFRTVQRACTIACACMQDRPLRLVRVRPAGRRPPRFRCQSAVQSRASIPCAAPRPYARRRRGDPMGDDDPHAMGFPPSVSRGVRGLSRDRTAC